MLLDHSPEKEGTRGMACVPYALNPGFNLRFLLEGALLEGLQYVSLGYMIRISAHLEHLVTESDGLAISSFYCDFHVEFGL